MIVTANEKKSSLPLNFLNPLAAMAAGSKDKVTPQQALIQTMAVMHQKVRLIPRVDILWELLIGVFTSSC